tara:strand:- start:1425 stop:3320 length:1896 start_codon:yes stop_codon:yes gene_type:complete
MNNKYFLKDNLENVLKLKTYLKISLLIVFDSLIIIFSLLIASILLSIDNFYYFKLNNYQYLLSLVLFAIPFYFFSGQYKDITRYIGSKSIYKIMARNIFIVFSLHIIFSPPLSFSFVLWTFISSISYTSRIILRDLILKFKKRKSNLSNVLIYGAGSAGARLLSNIKAEGNFEVKGFIDDDLSLKGRSILGIRIYSPKEISYIKSHLNIEKILLAVPSADKKSLEKISENINTTNIELLQMPSLTDIVTGKSKINKLKPINIESLLGRGVVQPYFNLLSKDIKDSVILISGAGGSIGSELCREIINFQPLKIILFDNSEPNLHIIFNQLISKDNVRRIEIIPLLGSVTNKKLVDHVIKSHKVSIIFHAAAYKHVPLVEVNPLQGLENNIISTRVLCECSIENNVKKFVLISSDKAVRPTNLMGASKRISELIVQAFHDQSILVDSIKDIKTIFLMVRFGNVINSSGSVIPLFREQIKNGGPITLTHENISRYFMTINEACQLVLQSASLAKGGDVFLLDMGKPVKIKDIAEQMISLSGLTLKNESNPNGDIEIKVIGLRKGEKLFEELLIESDSLPTEHPLIFRAKENHMDFDKLMPALQKLEFNLINQDLEESLKCVSYLVPEWKSKTFM